MVTFMQKNNILFLVAAAFLTLLIGLWLGCTPPKSEQETTLAYGKRLYESYCVTCHQEDGAGFAKLYPPLLNSDYLTEQNRKAVICLIKNGRKGELVVNGVTYNQPMPANKDLSEEAIAAITTYIYQTFAKQNIDVVTLEVQEALSECGS